MRSGNFHHYVLCSSGILVASTLHTLHCTQHSAHCRQHCTASATVAVNRLLQRLLEDGQEDCDISCHRCTKGQSPASPQDLHVGAAGGSPYSARITPCLTACLGESGLTGVHCPPHWCLSGVVRCVLPGSRRLTGVWRAVAAPTGRHRVSPASRSRQLSGQDRCYRCGPGAGTEWLHWGEQGHMGEHWGKRTATPGIQGLHRERPGDRRDTYRDTGGYLGIRDIFVYTRAHTDT